MKKNKRGDIKFILIIIMLIAGFLAVYFFDNTKEIINEKETNQKWVDKETFSTQKEDNTQNENTQEENTYTLEGNTGGGDGGGGGQSETTTNCIIRKISYSVKTVNQEEECELYENNECIQKKITCSAEIINEDSVTLDFTMELLFVPDGKNKEEYGFGRKVNSFTLGSKQSTIMSGTATIEKTIEENFANENINCFFNTIGSLEQEICT